MTASKLLICPYFGDLPPWMDSWYANSERLLDYGYRFLHDNDESAFHDRVRDRLGIEPPPMTGTGNIWDFRPAFGLLYAEELAGFQWWGTTDFDCVYGRIERWVTDEALADLDLLSNHVDYVCGQWSLYRNVPLVNHLFALTQEWRDTMSHDGGIGWVEKGYTAIVDQAHERGLIRRRYVEWQTRDWDSFDTLRLEPDGALMEGDTERMMAHFRRTKVYPAGCVL